MSKAEAPSLKQEWESLKVISQQLDSGNELVCFPEEFKAMISPVPEMISPARIPPEKIVSRSIGDDGMVSPSNGKFSGKIEDGEFIPTLMDVSLLKLYVLTTLYEQYNRRRQRYERFHMLLEDKVLWRQVFKFLDHSNVFISRSAYNSVMHALQSYSMIDHHDLLELFLTVCCSEESPDTMLQNSLDICSELLMARSREQPESNLLPTKTLDIHRTIDPVVDRIFRKMHEQWSSLLEKHAKWCSNDEDTMLLSHFKVWKMIIQIFITRQLGAIKELACLFHTFSDFLPMFDVFKESNNPVVWKHGISVLNKAVSYAKLVSLGISTKGYKTIARIIAQKMVVENLLQNLPVSKGFVGFGGTDMFECKEEKHLSTMGDVTLLKKFAMLVLRSAALIVDQAESSAEDQNLALRCVDVVAKQVMSHGEWFEREWITSLFEDQDDLMIEALLCLHSIASKNFSGSTEIPNVSFTNPHYCFQSLLKSVSYDHSVLLDLLLSPETCFLVYFLRYLHTVIDNWQALCDCLSYLDNRDDLNVSTDAKDSDRLCFDTKQDVLPASATLSCQVESSKYQRHAGLVEYSDSDSDDVEEIYNQEDGPLCSSANVCDIYECETDISEFNKSICDSNAALEMEDTEVDQMKYRVLQKGLGEIHDCDKCERDDEIMVESNMEKCKRKDCVRDATHGGYIEGRGYTSTPYECDYIESASDRITRDNINASNTMKSKDRTSSECSLDGETNDLNPALILCETDISEDTGLDRTMTLLIRLRISMEKISDKKLFPFNVVPLISLLEKCEELYES